MIIKILGVLDIIAAILFWIFGIFGIIPSSLILLFAFIILTKGLVFLISDHIASVIDVIIAGVMFLSLSVHIPIFIVIIFAFLLIQKGIVSLL